MEILGLLDTLESMILDGSRIPFTKKIYVNEEKILGVVDKIRLVVQGGGSFAKDAISSKNDLSEKGQPQTSAVEQSEKETSIPVVTGQSGEAVEVLQQAYQMAKEIRDGADKYADEVLANLEATSMRIMRTLKAGRERLAKTTKPGEVNEKG
jgi:hypothetical protein